MSDYTPITGELRDAMCKWGWVERDGSIMFTTSPIPTSIDAEQSLVISGSDFDRLCDSIDAIHAQLEKENAALKAELDRVTGEQEEHAHTMGESIANELREYALGWDERNRVRCDLTAIADRIDAEHERQLEVLHRDMSDAEYVKLHKDTGGEYINEHDKVDWRDHAGTWHENATVVAVCDDGCYVVDGAVFHVHKSDIRHHHAPTVEDVLREFADGWGFAEGVGKEDSYMKTFAAKLRLVGDAE